MDIGRRVPINNGLVINNYISDEKLSENKNDERDCSIEPKQYLDKRNILMLLREINSKIHTDGRLHHIENVEYIIDMISNISTNYQNTPDLDLKIIAAAHDLFKELNFEGEYVFRSISPNLSEREIIFTIPSDLRRYVRTNLDILEIFGLDYYFNTDVGLHALSAGIFLYKEFGIKDPNILYPIFFHTCPIVEVYDKLDDIIKNNCELLILADKLDKFDRKTFEYENINDESKKIKMKKNDKYLRYNLREILFGKMGNEFNKRLAIFTIRYLEAGNKDGIEAKNTYQYFYDLARETNPFLPKKYPS